MSARVEFFDVGREKRMWTEPLRANLMDADAIERAVAGMVRKSGALMSRSIEAVISEDGETGAIIVGGFRRVGGFRVAEQTSPTPERP